MVGHRTRRRYRVKAVVIVVCIILPGLLIAQSDDLDGGETNSATLSRMLRDTTGTVECLIDTEFVCDSGSIFVVRIVGPEDELPDTVYSFWAMTRDSTGVAVWPFAAIAWGVAGEQYYDLMAKDSLSLLFQDGPLWRKSEIWRFAVEEKDSTDVLTAPIDSAH
jgi:hypothetical protein